MKKKFIIVHSCSFISKAKAETKAKSKAKAFFVLSFSFYIRSSLHVSKHFLCQFFQLGKSPAKFELGCQVQTWQTSRKELVENILRPKNLAAKFELGRNRAKFKLGCQVQNLAKKLKLGRIICHMCGSTIAYNMVCPQQKTCYFFLASTVPHSHTKHLH